MFIDAHGNELFMKNGNYRKETIMHWYCDTYQPALGLVASKSRPQRRMATIDPYQKIYEVFVLSIIFGPISFHII